MGEAISKFIVRLTSPPSLRAVHRYWPPSSSCKWIQMDSHINANIIRTSKASSISSRFFQRSQKLKARGSTRQLKELHSVCLMPNDALARESDVHFKLLFHSPSSPRILVCNLMYSQPSFSDLLPTC